MPHVTMKTLYAKLAPEFGMEPRRVEYYGRFLREASLLDVGRPGRGGSTPEATAYSAAALVVAILGSESAVGAGDAVKALGSLRGSEITLQPPNTDERISLAPKGTFLDTVAHILDKMGDEQDGNPWRKFVREIGAVSTAVSAYALIKVGTSPKTMFQHIYQPTGVDGHLAANAGLARETRIGAETLHRIADLLSGKEKPPEDNRTTT